jgi:acetyltransferase-like isoleucine patch superfamily enzyme
VKPDSVNQKSHAVLWVRIARVILNKKRIMFLAIFSRLQNKTIAIGSNFSVGAKCNFRSAGEIIFENHVGMASQVVVETNLRIGQGSIISSQVAFIGNDHSVTPGQSTKLPPKKKADVKIGSNCWIGYGVIIIGPVNICSDVIIGAGSVVTRDIEEPGVYVGSPAKKIH